MKATELRIKNWIKCTGNDIDTGKVISMDCQVESLPMNREGDYNIGVDFPSEDNCDCEGIPLTGDWAKRCQFLENSHNSSVWYSFEDEDGSEIYRIEFIENGVPVLMGIYNGSGEVGQLVHLTNVEHVHKLQNVMFSLTDEELEIEHNEKQD